MLVMILKMSAATLLYVLTTVILWKKFGKRKMTWGIRAFIGIVYGLLAVFSTHVGVDYIHMMLNVRDIGPLAAGLFFDPISGIIAGLIGGIERFIAGTYFGVGSYTRIACSVSTCLAGFLAACLHIFVFRRRKPSPMYAFFMGSVMEVFHMYAVFITHRDDMSMAYYVVQICAPPMILFTGIGLAVSSWLLLYMSGQRKIVFKRLKGDEISVSQRFQYWLFAVTSFIMLVSFCFSFVMQTQSANQNGKNTLLSASEEIRRTSYTLYDTKEGMEKLVLDVVLRDAVEIAREVENAGGLDKVDEAFLENRREYFDLKAVTAVRSDGSVAASSGNVPVYRKLFTGVLDGTVSKASGMPSATYVAGGARCGDGMIQTVADMQSISERLNLAAINDTLSNLNIGNEGTFDVFSPGTGIVSLGAHKGKTFSLDEVDQIKAYLRDEPDLIAESFMTMEIFGVKSLCHPERMENGQILLVSLPTAEVYKYRNESSYETGLADILYAAVIYVLISMLVQQIVVNNLELVNQSLSKITGGDLNEVVDVRNSSEFASLSDDINLTVEVLKGYISAAEKRIEQELEFARSIQDSALPKNFTLFKNRIELWAGMDPAKEVGGDFYDFFYVNDHTLALVIADVSGKGIPAALFMMRSKTAIRSLAELGMGPAEILYKANNSLCEGNDAQMFVTAWVGILDIDTSIMKCANAGHEYPALSSKGGEFALYKDKHGVPLAAMEDVLYREYELEIGSGDKLFVYTDGIPEAINKDCEQYGSDRLVEKLNEVKDLPVEEILHEVREDIRKFAGEAEQFDDITMVGIRLT